MLLNDQIRLRLEEIQKNANKSRGDFATSLGLTSPGLSRIIKGDVKTLSTQNELALQMVYKVNLNWLESGVGEKYLRKELDISKELGLDLEQFDRFLNLFSLMKNNDLLYNVMNKVSALPMDDQNTFDKILNNFEVFKSIEKNEILRNIFTILSILPDSKLRDIQEEIRKFIKSSLLG